MAQAAGDAYMVLFLDNCIRVDRQRIPCRDTDTALDGCAALVFAIIEGQ